MIDDILVLSLSGVLISLCAFIVSLGEPPSPAKKVIFGLSGLFLSFCLPFFVALLMATAIDFSKEF